jgi:hypothetical protein
MLVRFGSPSSCTNSSTNSPRRWGKNARLASGAQVRPVVVVIITGVTDVILNDKDVTRSVAGSRGRGKGISRLR